MSPRVAGVRPAGRLIQWPFHEQTSDTLGRQIIAPGSKGGRDFEERYFMIG